MSATVSIIGNVTRDPELRYSGSGMAWTTFSVAVNHRKKKGDEYEELTSFYDVVCFGDMAENAAESLSKGTRVLVAGSLDMETYVAKDGTEKLSPRITAEEIAASLRFATVVATKVAK
jgi:single-strand DNA-binding protein